MSMIYRPLALGYERVYLPLYKVTLQSGRYTLLYQRISRIYAAFLTLGLKKIVSNLRQPYQKLTCTNQTFLIALQGGGRGEGRHKSALVRLQKMVNGLFEHLQPQELIVNV